MIQATIALGIISGLCLFRAWSLGQWPFQKKVWMMTVHFIPDEYPFENGAVITRRAPLIWFTTMHIDDVMRHAPTVGSWLGDARVESVEIYPA